ncbi:MAG: hypothetical protein JWO02_1390 [Solirubrobacterales bacterium]|nr:hypothetical protein [Solirubrobacterales bacterium]
MSEQSPPPTAPRERRHVHDPLGPLLEIIVLVAILVGAVLAIAQAHAWWTAAIAVAGLTIAAVGTARTAGTMLRADEAPPLRPSRRGAIPTTAAPTCTAARGTRIRTTTVT